MSLRPPHKTLSFFFKCQGIARHKTTPHTPEKNGSAKSLKQTLIKKTWSMKEDVGLRKIFWVESVEKTILSLKLLSIPFVKLKSIYFLVNLSIFGTKIS
jgi:hypothetical protein